MRKAEVLLHDKPAGILEEISVKQYRFSYYEYYSGPPVSLTMPVSAKEYIYDKFPPFFEGLLPEGLQLEALLRREKLDRNDFFGQLLVVGTELVGAVSIREIK